MTIAAVDKVFHNDYIMLHILRMLNLKDHYQLQNICPRLRYLVTCVWRRECVDIQLNRNKTGVLEPEEFLGLLYLNANSVQELTVNIEDSIPLYLNFRIYYRNLMALHIKWPNIGFSLIVKSCPQLQLFEYDGCRHWETAPNPTVLPLPTLMPLTELRTIIFKNLGKSVSCDDLWKLAHKVPLERVELHDVGIVRTSGHEWKDRCALPRLKILKITGSKPHKSHRTIAEFLSKCPNLIDLQLVNVEERAFANTEQFQHLETFKLVYCISPQTLCDIMKLAKLKHLGIIHCHLKTDICHISGDVRGICANLHTLEVTRQHSNPEFWLNMFRSPLTSFQNLQQLTLTERNVCDELICLVSIKCPQLLMLHLTMCEVSGRYINQLHNLHSLTIQGNFIDIMWSKMYSILSDLRLLQNLDLTCIKLAKDDSVPTTQYLQPVAISLQVLKLRGVAKNPSFFEHVLRQCPDSFPNVHTLHIRHCMGLSSHQTRTLIGSLKQLSSLQFVDHPCVDICAKLIPRVRHLSLINCQVRGHDVLTILNSSAVESAEIIQTKISAEKKTRAQTQKMMQHLRAVTIQYSTLIKTLRIWDRFLESCPRFRLCCIDHEAHTVVLEKLFKYATVAKQRQIEIHVNSCLHTVRSYCAANLSNSNVSLCLLDEHNKRLWNPRFANIMFVIIIEIS